MKEESEVWICFSPFCELSISDIKYVEGLRGRVSAFLDIVQGDKETQELTDDEFYPIRPRPIGALRSRGENHS